MRKALILLILLLFTFPSYSFTYKNGNASLSPYPGASEFVEYPDSLTPIFINHVGRHGSRYPAGAFHSKMLQNALLKADSLKTITKLGQEMLKDVTNVVELSEGNWGQLNSIGENEHRGIAERMYFHYPQLFDTATIQAISSYSPRCIMSMTSFLHQLAKNSSNLTIETASGKKYSRLVRNFDIDEDYKAFRKSAKYNSAYKKFQAANVPIEPLLRIVGEDFPLDPKNMLELALAEYYVCVGMDAMGIDYDPSPYFTLDEYRKMWSVFNFRQYLLYSASVLSNRPAQIAGPLLQDIIQTSDAKLAGKLDVTAKLRFGHAETLMPLLGLLQVPGAYYLTNYYDTLADNWQDYAMFPMASNLQFVFFEAESGEVYVRVDYNEKPVRLIHDAKSDYVKWSDLRTHLLELVPLY